MGFNEIKKGGKDFVGYEYKTVTTESDRASMYLDGYENFGWMLDDSMRPQQFGGVVTLKLKRDRKILNKTELTRLQKHFEACMDDIRALERSKAHTASVVALSAGVTGTAFMAGSVFAVTHEPPWILLCVILAIPGFIGWILPYFLFKHSLKKRADTIAPLIEQKYDEIYRICEKGSALIGNRP